MAMTGFFSIGFIASANALVQLEAEPHFRGRVMGIWIMAMPGMTPISAVAYAVLADVAGVRWALFTAGSLLAAVAASQVLLAGRYRSAGAAPAA